LAWLDLPWEEEQPSHRAYGLGIDNLLSAQVVTADGQLLPQTPKNIPISGTTRWGGNFGVVVSLEYRLHPPRIGMLLIR